MPPGRRFALIAAVAFLLAIPAIGLSQEAGRDFSRGDVEGNNSVNIADPIRILNFLFVGEGGSIGCIDTADVDDDGRVTVGDAIALLNYLFARAPAPAAPFARCGPDPTTDDLGCVEYDLCARHFGGIGYREPAVVFVVDRSGSMQDSGELAIAKQAVARNLRSLSPEMEFGIVFLDNGINQFPANGVPVRATAENIETGLAWVASRPGGSGSCLFRGLVIALRIVEQTDASDRVVFYAGDGGDSCLGWDTTLEVVAAENVNDVTIHTIGVLDVDAASEVFLRELARQNGGRYLCCGCSSECQ